LALPIKYCQGDHIKEDEMGGTCMLPVRICGKKRLHERSKHRQDDIKMNLKERGSEDVD
jgi:hypothetical protein